MSKKDRMETLRNIYTGLNEGGAFIFAEKTICESALVQDMITFNYYDYKRKTFTTEDIMNIPKWISLWLKDNFLKQNIESNKKMERKVIESLLEMLLYGTGSLSNMFRNLTKKNTPHIPPYPPLHLDNFLLILDSYC